MTDNELVVSRTQRDVGRPGGPAGAGRWFRTGERPQSQSWGMDAD